MSKLIIVCNEEHADKIVPSNSELDFAKKIPVYGKLFKIKNLPRGVVKFACLFFLLIDNNNILQDLSELFKMMTAFKD
jgi:hypothetical protein